MSCLDEARSIARGNGFSFSRIFIFGCSVLLAACQPTAQLTLQVSSTLDGPSGSLRAAIAAANSASPRRYTSIVIEVPAGTYELTRCRGIGVQSGDLDLTTALPVTLKSDGAPATIRQTCVGERVLEASGPLTMNGLTLTGGSLAGTDRSVPAQGGALRSLGDLVLNQVTISGNSATGAPGSAATASAPAVAGGSAEGGGVYAAGSIMISGGSFENNQAIAGLGSVARGGGLAQAEAAADATIDVQGATFSGNAAVAGESLPGSDAPDARGGALAAAGKLSLENVTATANGARAGAGTQQNGAVVSQPGVARGGAIHGLGSVTIQGGTYSQNRASGGAMNPACAVDSTDPNAPACASSPGLSGAAGEAAVVWAGADLIVTGGAYSDNVSEGGKGQFYYTSSYPLRGRYPRGNAGPTLASAAAATIEGGEFSGNTGGQSGGRLIDGPPYTLACDTLGAAAATVTGARFHDNSGGLSITGDVSLYTTQLLDNASGVQAGSVHAENTTLTGRGGAGIRATTAASLVNTTLSGSGQGVDAPTVFLEHATIDVQPFATDPNDPPVAVLQVERLSSRGSVIIAPENVPVCSPAPSIDGSAYNWFSDATCALAGPGDQQSRAEFLLQDLADNGGPVPTRLPSAASVLIDRIPSSACSLSIDARGVRRPQGNGCDIGAVEVEPASGTGPTDLALQFEPTSSLTEYQRSASWQFTIVNRGPNATEPVLAIDATDMGYYLSASASNGGSCKSIPYPAMDFECSWPAPLAVGQSVTVTVNGDQFGIFNSYPHVETWHAQIIAPQLLPPFDDDQGDLVITIYQDPAP